MKKTRTLPILLPSILIALLLCARSVPAQTSLPLRGPVNDFAEVIDPSTEARMEEMLRNFKERSGGIEITVVTVKSLEGRPIEDFALELGRQWKLGSGADHGSVILLTSIDDRKMRIEVSRHLEGDLPDALVGEIAISLRPYFRSGDYSSGLMFGAQSLVTTLAQRRGIPVEGIDRSLGSRQRERQSPPRRRSGSEGTGLIFIVIVIVVFVILSQVRRFGRGGHRGGGWGRRNTGLDILEAVIWSNILFGGGRGGFGGHRGGRDHHPDWSGWGGSSGGDWGGSSGGGDFGGGGASDSW